MIYNKKIVIFGTGEFSGKISTIVKDIAYYVDNFNFNRKFNEKDVFSPSKLIEENKENIFIIIASMYFGEISSQLIDIGFKYEQHFVEYERYFEFYPSALSNIYTNVEFGNGVQLIGIQNIEIGRGTIVADNVWINDSIRSGEYKIRVGNKCNVGRNSMINAANSIEIGDFCLMGPNVLISNADHSYEDITTPIIFQQAKKLGKIVIEENVWLAKNVAVIGKVKIGRGSIIGANSVVRNDLPPFCVAVGNPAKIVKLFDLSKNTWEVINSEKEYENIMNSRKKCKLPTRKEYSDLLTDKFYNVSVSNILAGKSRSI